MAETKQEFQITPGEVVLGAEVIIGILASVATFGVFPGWLVLLLPILSADIPLASSLFTQLWNMLAAAKQTNTPPSTILKALHDGVVTAHATCKAEWEAKSPDHVWPDVSPADYPEKK